MLKPLGYVNTHTHSHTHTRSNDKTPLRLQFCLAVTTTQGTCISAPYQSEETRMWTGGGMSTCKGDKRQWEWVSGRMKVFISLTKVASGQQNIHLFGWSKYDNKKVKERVSARVCVSACLSIGENADTWSDRVSNMNRLLFLKGCAGKHVRNYENYIKTTADEKGLIELLPELINSPWQKKARGSPPSQQY